ncbi:hypothetical protein KFU94_36365 [Chloroflexi bacterium TSY]|nr:hypothetical protein [Chloroflexi bacterium TSY]
MKSKILFGSFLAILLALSGRFTFSAAAQTTSGSQLTLRQSDEKAIVVELRVDDFTLTQVKHDGQIYHRISIPGMVQSEKPGDPQVPTLGTLLGVPTTDGVSIELMDASYEVLEGIRLHPTPAMQPAEDTLDSLLAGDVQQVFTLNRVRYETDAFYPDTTVETSTNGLLRDQPVIQVQFFPVQTNPVTGEMRLYRRLLARITWDIPVSTAGIQVGTTSPAYEDMLRKALLNYSALHRPILAERGSSDTSRQRKLITANGAPAALKIGVTEDGLYELTYDDLTTAGLDLSEVAPRTIQISNRGNEIPIIVRGEEDGAFDTADSILFYGIAITNTYTTKNVYWLTVGRESGQRMNMRDGTLSGNSPVPTHFPVTLHAEEDTYYWVTMPNGQGQDYWFWEDKLTAPDARDYTLTLQNLSTTAMTATMRVRLKGHTDTDVDPDHHTKILLNGVAVDEQMWDGISSYDHDVNVPHATLQEGTNTVRVEGVGDTGAAADQFYLNWIEIEYWDTYVAENEQLLFGAPAAGTHQFEVTGFSTDTVLVFDVTEPANAVFITNTIVVADGDGYKVQFEESGQVETRYLALAPARYKSPVSLELDQPSTWKAPSKPEFGVRIRQGQGEQGHQRVN